MDVEIWNHKNTLISHFYFDKSFFLPLHDFFSFCAQFFVNFFSFTIARLPLESQQSIVEFKKVGLTKYRIANIKEKDKKNRPKGLEGSHPEYLRLLYKSMPRRMAAVIASQEGHTKY